MSSNPLYLLLRSRKVWTALIALAVAVLLQLVPDFPKDVLDRIIDLAQILIAAIAVEDVAGKLGAMRAGPLTGPVPSVVPPPARLRR